MALSLSLGEPRSLRFDPVFILYFKALSPNPAKTQTRVPNDIHANGDRTRSRRIAQDRSENLGGVWGAYGRGIGSSASLTVKRSFGSTAHSGGYRRRRHSHTKNHRKLETRTKARRGLLTFKTGWANLERNHSTADCQGQNLE